MKIFICHSWETHTNEYDLLCKIISRALGNWTNLSIPKREPYQIWKTGKIAWEAQTNIFEKRSIVISDKLPNLYLVKEKLATELSVLNRDNHFGSTLEEINRKLTELNENLEGTISSILARKEELKKRAENRKKIVASVNFKLLAQFEKDYNSLSEKIRNLESELRQIHERLKKSYDRFHSLEEFAIVDEYEVKFDKFGRRERYYPANLKEEITNRILECDIFVALAGMFSFYQQWMEFELDLASQNNKYIIALLPINQKSLPREVINVCSDFSNFDSEEIKRILKNASMST